MWWTKMEWNGCKHKKMVYSFAVCNLLLGTFSSLYVDLLWFSTQSESNCIHSFYIKWKQLWQQLQPWLYAYTVCLSRLCTSAHCAYPRSSLKTARLSQRPSPQDLRVCCKRNIPAARWCHWQATWCEWCVFCSVMFGLPQTVWYDCQNAQSGFARAEHSFFCVWQLPSCLQPRWREPKVRAQLHRKNNVSHRCSF